MSEEEILAYWKQGYTVKQIASKSVIVQKCKNKEVTHMVVNRIEKIILKYQSLG